MDVQNVKRVLRFVGDFHSLVRTGRQLSIDALEHLTGRHGRFLPSGVLVREVLSLFVDELMFVGNVEKVSRHFGKNAALEKLFRLGCVPIEQLAALCPLNNSRGKRTSAEVAEGPTTEVTDP
ncbi:hypothetical protein RPS27_21695 [Bradyrhizobium sp. WYCCWR 12699]|nr:hypothetical protein [Bradyrhizobium sp. WYCCWR 12699]MDT4740332.1 hypothetical protein [Bradyrhizobium sp. WYCCWR 12699]